MQEDELWPLGTILRYAAPPCVLGQRRTCPAPLASSAYALPGAAKGKITLNLQKVKTENRPIGLDTKSWEYMNLCIWTGSVVDKSILQESSKDKEDADLQSTNNQMFSFWNISENKYFYPGPHVNCLGVGHRGQGIVYGCLQEKGNVKIV